MCELTPYRQAGFIDELGKATRFGGLPDAVLAALVKQTGNFDMDVEDIMRTIQRLRPQTIEQLPVAVLRQVEMACEETRRERSEQ